MIHTTINNRQHLLQEILPNNPGIIIIKFTATWCKPCQIIKETVYKHFQNAPDDILCYDVDIDENFDVFAYLKSKKMVTGIPAILVWEQGNDSFAPDDGISGGDVIAVDNFLNNIFQK